MIAHWALRLMACCRWSLIVCLCLLLGEQRETAAQTSDRWLGTLCQQNLNRTQRSPASSAEREVIVLGRIPERQYGVVIPGEDQETLNLVRQCVPDAFVSDSRLGSYIQVGIFTDRDTAERLSDYLRSQQLDARVVYFR